jgi:hypothetical protein
MPRRGLKNPNENPNGVTDRKLSKLYSGDPVKEQPLLRTRQIKRQMAKDHSEQETNQPSKRHCKLRTKNQLTENDEKYTEASDESAQTSKEVKKLTRSQKQPLSMTEKQQSCRRRQNRTFGEKESMRVSKEHLPQLVTDGSQSVKLGKEDKCEEMSVIAGDSRAKGVGKLVGAHCSIAGKWTISFFHTIL